jgi:hypothetical protein
MSMVTVHGPNTMYSKAVVQNASGTAYATPNPANGLIWTFKARDESQVAANYDWAYTPAGGTPVSPIPDTKSPTITFTGAGAKTVTLTLNGVAQPPITVTAVAGAAPLMQQGESDEVVDVDEYVHSQGDGFEGSVVEPVPQDSGSNGDDEEVEVGYDPAAHTVTEVIGFVEDNPDELENIISAEHAGKQRVTLLTHLESMRVES